MIIAGTGSRSLVKEIDKFLKVQAILVQKIQDTPDLEYVISGMAEGFDECLAEAAMLIGFPYHVYIPNEGYGKYYWEKNSLSGLNRYHRFVELVTNAAHVEYICDRIYEGGKHSNFIRNEAMVNAADKMWVWDPTSKGTSHCVAYAQRIGKPYEVIEIHEEA